jgi:hypothetical protein
MNDMQVPSVYLMRRKDRRWKLGFSIDPQSRLHGLGKNFFTIVQTWPATNAWQIEQICHRLLRPYLDVKVPGRETYKATKATILAAVDEAFRLAAEKPDIPTLPRKLRAERPVDLSKQAAVLDLVEKYALAMEVIRNAQV